MNNFNGWIKISLGLFLCIQLLGNFIVDYSLIRYPERSYSDLKYEANRNFIKLKPYLKNVRVAGYWTDFTPKHPDVDNDFMARFYWVQNVLTPTYLDHYRPLDHEWVIVSLKHSSSLVHLLNQFKAKIIVRLSPQIILIQKSAL